jgi:haloacetate dehalogenase
MFDGFRLDHIDVGEATLRVRARRQRPAAGPAARASAHSDDLARRRGHPLAIWRRWADDIVGVPIKSGHHMAEENPAARTDALAELLRR